MNYLQLLIAFAIGVISSHVSTFIQSRRTKKRQKQKYGKMAGKYDGFVFQTQNSRKLSSQPASTAEIVYIKDNLLKIRLNHNSRSWEGFITMEIERYGSLVWNYLDLPQEEYEFGFKRCIVNSPDEIYLIGEKLDGYDREVLKRITS